MTLSGIREALLAELGGDSSKLYFINTRLILSVGVNLNEITDGKDGDPKSVESVLLSLRKMGFLRDAGGSRGV